MLVMKNVFFFDSTLRDGSHALRQQLLPEHIEAYCRKIDNAGMYTVIIGHGNGLGASSILMTRSAMPEMDMVKLAGENLKRTKLGVFVTVGFGTIEDHIQPSMDLGAKVFCIASHCTEANTMIRHIKYISQRGKECYGVLMNSHMPSPEKLLEQAKIIEDNGADGIILMDSAGAYTPERTERVFSLLFGQLGIKIGFHPHNNLSMAVSNAYTAVRCGASVIDGTIRGFGSGAGNCQLEALAALLEKEGYETGTDLYQMLDAGDEVIEGLIGYAKGVDGISIVSGSSGVVSTFKHEVVRLSRINEVDPRDVFCELGRRRAISGQDDLIFEAVQFLKSKKH